MRFSLLLPAVLTALCVEATLPSGTFIRSHPEKRGIKSNDVDFPSRESSSFPGNATKAPVIPKAYIIQLKSNSELLRRDATHSTFHKRASGIDYTVRQEFNNPDLFLGLSIQVNDDSNTTSIEDIPDVVRVWPVTTVPRPDVIGGKAPATTLKSFAEEEPALSPQAGPRAEVNALHRLTEVDRLHAMGIKGKKVSSNCRFVTAYTERYQERESKSPSWTPELTTTTKHSVAVSVKDAKSLLEKIS